MLAAPMMPCRFERSRDSFRQDFHLCECHTVYHYHFHRIKTVR